MRIIRPSFKKPIPMDTWHKWFAWHPVLTETSLVWLEHVHRMKVEILIETQVDLVSGYLEETAIGYRYEVTSP